MIEKIETIADVKAFFRQLQSEDLNFHPDTLFDDYVNLETGKLTYTIDESKLRDELLSTSFEVCESEAVDIYELAFEIAKSRYRKLYIIFMLDH